MFLDALLADSKPRALRALEEIKTAKQRRQGLDSLPRIESWDRDAYFAAVAQEPPVRLPSLSPGLALHAFSRLLNNIYGISLRPTDTQKGEVWHNDVRKLEVVDETEGVIGWIYFDLFARYGKAGGATHYTIRCSRRVDDDDGDQDFNPDEPRELTPELERQWILHTERHVNRTREGAHQRPIAVISCDLDPLRAKSMAWQDVVTLWHELGHAMHCESF
jgi:intermediate peptidase